MIPANAPRIIGVKRRLRRDRTTNGMLKSHVPRARFRAQARLTATDVETLARPGAAPAAL